MPDLWCIESAVQREFAVSLLFVCFWGLMELGHQDWVRWSQGERAFQEGGTARGKAWR